MNPIPWAYMAIIIVALEDYKWKVQCRKNDIDSIPDETEVSNILGMELRVNYLLDQLNGDTMLRDHLLFILNEDISPNVENLVNDITKSYWEARIGLLDSGQSGS